MEVIMSGGSDMRLWESGDDTRDKRSVSSGHLLMIENLP